MNYQNLCELITSIIPTPQIIKPDSRLASDLGLCSFDMMLLLYKLEETVDIQIDVSKLKNDMTVEELLKIIERV